MSNERYSIRSVAQLMRKSLRFSLSDQSFAEKKRKVSGRLAPKLKGLRSLRSRMAEALALTFREGSPAYAVAALHGYRDFAAHCWKALPVSDSKVFFCTNNARGLSTDILAILRELQGGGYGAYGITIACPKAAVHAARNQLRGLSCRDIRITADGSTICVRAASEAKYVLMDAIPQGGFYKKDGQILLSLRRDRPFREEGRIRFAKGIPEPGAQRLLSIADYLMARSEDSMRETLNRYELCNIAQGTILYTGYPGCADWMRRAAVSKPQKTYLYMPSESEALRPGCIARLYDRLEYYLTRLDALLEDNEQVLVYCSRQRAGKYWGKLRHIRLLESMAQLQAVTPDGWIADYFDDIPDCIHAGIPIVRFAFDEPLVRQAKLSARPYGETGFPTVYSVEALVQALRSAETNYEQTIERFAAHDRQDAARTLCRAVFSGDITCKAEKIPDNGRENVLIFNGTLVLNGLTTSLLNLLSSIRLDRRNYIVCMLDTGISESGSRVALLPDGVQLLTFSAPEGTTSDERTQIDRLLHGKALSKTQEDTMSRFFCRCNHLNFSDLRLDYCIQFPGYAWRVLLQFAFMPCETMIFVHNDRQWEANLNRINTHVMHYAFRRYKKLAIVTEDIRESTLASGASPEKVVVINNLIPAADIRRRGAEPIVYTPEDPMTATPEQLFAVMNSTAEKFITVGRFEYQKGHAMLLKAFDRYYADHPDSYLIIIGGHGTLLEETIRLAGSLPSGSHILILCGVENPMPIVKRCDFFLLPSVYEGFGLTLAEALALGVPSMATDIPGPRGFMKRYGGYMAEPTPEALYEAMLAFSRGEIQPLTIDFDAYNRAAVQAFDEALVSALPDSEAKGV